MPAYSCKPDNQKSLCSSAFAVGFMEPKSPSSSTATGKPGGVATA